MCKQSFTFEYMEVCVLRITHGVCITYITFCVAFVWVAMSYFDYCILPYKKVL